MECLVNLLRQLAADPFYGSYIFHPCPCHTLQAAKLREQALTTFWTYARNTLQRGTTTALVPALAVTGNGKSVRLVPDLLYQVQCRRVLQAV